MSDEIIRYEWMGESQVHRVGEIDRREHVMVHYQMEGAVLKREAVDWQVPGWRHEGEGEFTIQHQIVFCQQHMACGGVMLGAFAGETLVGAGLLQPEIREGITQLAFLHVSRDYRRRGIASRLLRELLVYARENDAKMVYVSSTPSGSAVGFYASHGFTSAEEVIEELYALEPEDIHMAMPL